VLVGVSFIVFSFLVLDVVMALTLRARVPAVLGRIPRLHQGNPFAEPGGSLDCGGRTRRGAALAGTGRAAESRGGPEGLMP